MNLLIIDDDKPKLDEIIKFVSENYAFDKIVEKGSYQSGLKEIMTNNPDLVLLDMNMRTYDPSEIDPTGGRPRHFAGLDILKQVKRKNINVKVIVVTQFPIFGGGKDEKTLDELTNTLSTEFADLFIGTVFYKYSENSWMKSLKQYIDVFYKSGN
jgi:CheY-like chemotaxis protein